VHVLLVFGLGVGREGCRTVMALEVRRLGERTSGCSSIAPRPPCLGSHVQCRDSCAELLG